MNTVEDKLQEIFNDIFNSEIVINRDLSATEVEEWDSVTQINIVLAAEQEFSIRFGIGEVERTENVGDFIDLIEEHLKHDEI